MKFIYLIAIFIASCASVNPPSDSELSNPDNYGDPVTPRTIEEHIRTHEGFFDPMSAVIRCSNPIAGWLADAAGKGFGYKYICSINAKNRFGGYTGANDKFFFLDQSMTLWYREGKFLWYKY